MLGWLRKPLSNTSIYSTFGLGHFQTVPGEQPQRAGEDEPQEQARGEGGGDDQELKEEQEGVFPLKSKIREAQSGAPELPSSPLGKLSGSEAEEGFSTPKTAADEPMSPNGAPRRPSQPPTPGAPYRKTIAFPMEKIEYYRNCINLKRHAGVSPALELFFTTFRELIRWYYKRERASACRDTSNEPWRKTHLPFNSALFRRSPVRSRSSDAAMSSTAIPDPGVSVVEKLLATGMGSAAFAKMGGENDPLDSLLSASTDMTPQSAFADDSINRNASRIDEGVAKVRMGTRGREGMRENAPGAAVGSRARPVAPASVHEHIQSLHILVREERRITYNLLKNLGLGEEGTTVAVGSSRSRPEGGHDQGPGSGSELGSSAKAVGAVVGAAGVKARGGVGGANAAMHAFLNRSDSVTQNAVGASQVARAASQCVGSFPEGSVIDADSSVAAGGDLGLPGLAALGPSQRFDGTKAGTASRGDGSEPVSSINFVLRGLWEWAPLPMFPRGELHLRPVPPRRSFHVVMHRFFAAMVS